jgi:cell division protein ZapE
MKTDPIASLSSVRLRLEQGVCAGKYRKDAAQDALALRLDTLLKDLASSRLARKSSALGWLFAKRAKALLPRGLYIHGEVGRGKSLLMDLFFEAALVRRKKRVHFHAFMADMHRRIHEKRQDISITHDPVLSVASELAQETWLLCFDELAVTDIADAMILSRLFTALFEAGVVVVATSNVAPDDLYRNGLNRALFLPFVERLKARCEIWSLDGEQDYRLTHLSAADIYHVPADKLARTALDGLFQNLSGKKTPQPVLLNVQGHTLFIPQAVNKVARASFADLCARPYAANDYLHLAHRFHTLILDDIPRLTGENRNEARRFIWLIDALYEHNVTFIASAVAQPEDLYQGEAEDVASQHEIFAFARTVSRLIEMRSQDWLVRSSIRRNQTTNSFHPPVSR